MTSTGNLRALPPRRPLPPPRQLQDRSTRGRRGAVQPARNARRGRSAAQTAGLKTSAAAGVAQPAAAVPSAAAAAADANGTPVRKENPKVRDHSHFLSPFPILPLTVILHAAAQHIGDFQKLSLQTVRIMHSFFIWYHCDVKNESGLQASSPLLLD